MWCRVKGALEDATAILLGADKPHGQLKEPRLP